jgi:hypothetical protein
MPSSLFVSPITPLSFSKEGDKGLIKIRGLGISINLISYKNKKYKIIIMEIGGFIKNKDIFSSFYFCLKKMEIKKILTQVFLT